VIRVESTLKCECGNEARYIDDRGEFCCGICPVKTGRDSIRISDVPQLLGWARITIEYLRGRNDHIPVGDSIQAMLGARAAVTCADASCAKTCACHQRGWGGHSEAMCVHLTAAINLPLFCIHCRQPQGSPHRDRCVVTVQGAPEKWRTKPDEPFCTVCWEPLDRGGNCKRCYLESVS
jgi:hypothetical protein